jgi:glutathione-regulated potassium-efflux system ancillary protein KefF
MIDVIYAHPYPQRSRANRALLEALRDLPFVKVRSLYDLYPDFAIDVGAEQRLLIEAKAVVWLHPLYWYSVPPLMKLWIDKVLAYGFAYGENTYALAGMPCQWVVTTGGDDDAYSPGGMHERPLSHFVPPIEQTARFCRMRWQPPIHVQGARRITDAELDAFGVAFRERVHALEHEDTEPSR